MKMYQVSTLQALMLGYTNPVVTVAELLEHGNIGLGTFKNIDGEMIVLDGVCYRAKDDGNVNVAEGDRGVPFSTVCYMDEVEPVEFGEFHFISENRKNGGHVFEIAMLHGKGHISKINSIELKLPDEPAFDTYSLKQASNSEIADVEQGKANNSES